MEMEIELAKLKPNPFRDFTVDPIDPENVKLLTASIKEDGFWGGIVCRRVNGDIQIGAGHHRVEAAKKAGIEIADVFIGDFDDVAMSRVYARENATQRGNSATAVAGSIASAIRLLVRAILVGDERISRILEIHLPEARGNLASAKGLGQNLIEKLLQGIPRITSYVVKEQLATLKKSGDYQRIITEVTQQIEAERQEAIKELKRLERERAAAQEEAEKRQKQLAEARSRAKEAKEKAERKEAEAAAKRAEADAKLADKRRVEFDTELQKFDDLRATRNAAAQVANYESEFDFAGVARFLKNEQHIRDFREIAFKEGVKPYLPVSKQADLAHELVRLAQDNREEISGRFIREHMVGLLSEAKGYERKLSREEQAALEAEDIRIRFERLQNDFCRNVRGMYSAGVDMLDLMAKHRTTTFNITNETRSVLKTAQSVITKLVNEI
jgi:ParB-like chromosome segregation protein Spo0J